MPLQVLYLDFDGVLHHDAVYRNLRRGIYVSQSEAPGRTLFEWVQPLVDALAPYPDVRIVLSTTWVRSLRYSRALERLPATLQARAIGSTYHSRVHDPRLTLGSHAQYTRLRGEEVMADVARRRPDRWIAVDDTDEGWPDEARRHLGLCHSDRGLGDADTRDRLVAALESHFR